MVENNSQKKITFLIICNEDKGGYFLIDHELMMNGTVRIGMKTPNFEAITTMGNVSLENYRGKWVILFSHPRRFYSSMYDRNYRFC